MAMRGHGDEINLSCFGHSNQFGRGVAFRQLTIDLKALGGQRPFQSFEIRAVGPHLLGFAEFEVVEMPCGKTIRHMDEQQLRTRQPCQAGDVREDRLVPWRVFNCDQNALIHLKKFYSALNVCQSR